MRVHIESVRCVFNNGEHNAFTDLCQFRGQLYLTFRSCPDGHMVFPTSRIRVMRSSDGVTWEQVCEFGVPERDVRDPHFLVFGTRLFVYTGTWLCEENRDINHHLGYCMWSDDGEVWRGPRFLEGTYGHYIWRAAAFGGKAYLCGRRKRAFARTADHGDGTRITESALMESDDGFVFKPVGFFQHEYGDETAFLFEPDGSLLAIARDGAAKNALMCRSQPPFTEWSRVKLARQIGGPMLAKWAGGYLIGGRKSEPEKPSRTALWWLVDDTLEEIAELPSGGDTSYPGFVALGDSDGLLSFYSSHEGSGTGDPPSAIYLADLRVVA